MSNKYAFAAILSLTAVALAQPAKQPQTRPALPFRDPQTSVPDPMPHLLYLPPGYGKDGRGKRWPLVLFLHGSGESGHDLERVKKHGPPKLVSEGRKFPFILVSPQTDHGWKASELGQLLDSIESQYAVDRDREYVTGLSMGGFGTWDIISAFPGRFAAAVMICGGGEPEKAARIKNTPLWVFHGAQDNVVPIERSKADVEALEQVSGEVRFTIYPDAKHDSWTITYNNPRVYNWLLKHRRPTPATTPASSPATQPASR